MACADSAAALAGVLLAAGRGSRLGGNKLEVMLAGRMLGLHAAHTLAQLRCGHLFAVIDPARAALATALDSHGFHRVENANPTAGLSSSIGLAARAAAMTTAHAMLICLADMPMITREHLIALIGAHRANADRIIASQGHSARMPPVIIPRSYWHQLASLTGDAGARNLMADAISIQASAAVLVDIDHPADLRAIRDRFGAPK